MIKCTGLGDEVDDRGCLPVLVGRKTTTLVVSDAARDVDDCPISSPRVVDEGHDRPSQTRVLAALPRLSRVHEFLSTLVSTLKQTFLSLFLLQLRPF